jgi:WD40 repeat protein/tRNA A-37 threonylcarbamoyl transferase component Bud32
MTVERLQRAREIFEKLVDVPHEQRERALGDACGSDSELRVLVQQLLANDDGGMGNFLATPAFVADAGPAGPGTDWEPQRVGGYEIIRLIGEGGMGTVYEAQQENPKRRVALKLIRPGLASGRLLRRFQREADLLGQLQHAGIAQIYDAGAAPVTTTAGRGAPQPFIAMELVRGESLCRYAERAGLATKARLALMADVCDAVQHAHQKGVIHRDLKPGNILVDASGQPKILDFGVARMADADVRTVTTRTEAGQLIGTLPYMSPEQVGGDSRAVDTRTDVYALGVILFELLSGRLPLAVETTSIPEAVRRIRDDAPARLASFDRSLRGEVEIIASKAIEKNVARRYQSASELAMDIRRHLRGEAIEARRDSALYMLRKSVLRHRVAVSVATLLVVMLAAFGIVSFNLAERNRRLAEDERQARDEALNALELAEREQQRADAASARLQAELTSSNIERGRLLGRQGDLFAAEELIWREHLRNPSSNQSYWALWELYLHDPSIAALGTQPGALHAVAYAPDGRLIASAGVEGVVMLWDGVALARVAALTGHAAPVHGLAFSPDGRRLASVSVDGTLMVWDVTTHARLRTWRGESNDLRSVCYSPDGTRLLCGSGDGAIHVLNATTLAVVRTLRGHTDIVWRLLFSPDGTLLASSSEDATIQLWRDLSGPPAATLAGHTRAVSALAFAADGQQLASGSADKTVKLWDLATCTCTETIPAANGTIRFLHFAPDARSLLVGGWWRVDEWDLATRTRRMRAPHGIGAAAIRADHRVLARACADLRWFPEMLIRLEDLATDAGVFSLDHSAGHWPAAVSPAGDIIAASDRRGRVRLWDTATGRPRSQFDTLAGRRVRCHFDHAGGILATCRRGAVELRDPATGALLRTLAGHHSATVHALAFSPDGNQFAATWEHGTVQIRRVPSGALVTTIPAAGSEALSVRYSPAGERLAVSYRAGMIRVYSAAGELQAEFDTMLCPWTIAFSPDGTKIAAACWARQIQIWDLATSARETTLEASTAVIWEVAYLPGQSDLVASRSDDGLVQLWDLRTRGNVLTFGQFDGSASSLSFTPDGKALIAAGQGDQPIRVWDLEYFDRHIAGNLEHQIALCRDALGDQIEAAALRDWAAEVRRRPWPRLGPRADSTNR